MNKKIFVLGLNSRHGHPADDVTQQLMSLLEALPFQFEIKKRTRAGCLVIEADEELLETIINQHPEFFIEEQKTLRH